MDFHLTLDIASDMRRW